MEQIRTATAAGVTTLTLDSPANRNALSVPLMRRLLAELAAAAADDDVRVVVLSHTGPVFCAGVDLKAPPEGPLPAEVLPELLAAVWEHPKPVVARVGGPARAGGLGLIAAADLAVCTTDATFAFTEVRLGVVPAVISATVLPRLAPRAATELFLTGDTFDGVRAERIGLVTAAVDPADLDAAVAGYCDALVRGGPLAVAATKQLLRRTTEGSFRSELAGLTELSARHFRSDEGREGIAAFAGRRPAAWVPVSGRE